MQGRVKWFNEKKGFGFIEGQGAGDDTFIHYSKIEGQGFKTLIDGEFVEYDREKGPRGWQATRVKKLEKF